MKRSIKYVIFATRELGNIWNRHTQQKQTKKRQKIVEQVKTCFFSLNFKKTLKSDEGRLFTIRPEESLKIGRLEKNPEKFDEIYSIGLMDGQGKFAALINYLEA